MSVEKVLNVLSETPNHLFAFTVDATPAELRAPPEPGEWSVAEILAHLRSCADVWGGAIELIVAENHPTIKAINPTSWIESTDYREVEFAVSFSAFTTQRAALLSLLERLPSKGWSRSATVEGAGRPLVRTVLTYADWLARHERSHRNQIEKTVAVVHPRSPAD
jgi:hypothetical protein